MAKDVCGLSNKLSGCEVIDLDELNLEGRHADLLVNCGGTVIVVEETSVAKSDDIDQVSETLEDVRSNGTKYGISSDPLRLVGVIHFTRRNSTQVVKVVSSRSKRNLTLLYANCCDDLMRKVRETLTRYSRR